jgi:hypothetical protein
MLSVGFLFEEDDDDFIDREQYFEDRTNYII